VQWQKAEGEYQREDGKQPKSRISHYRKEYGENSKPALPHEARNTEERPSGRESKKKKKVGKRKVSDALEQKRTLIVLEDRRKRTCNQLGEKSKDKQQNDIGGK